MRQQNRGFRCIAKQFNLSKIINCLKRSREYRKIITAFLFTYLAGLWCRFILAMWGARIESFIFFMINRQSYPRQNAYHAPMTYETNQIPMPSRHCWPKFVKWKYRMSRPDAPKLCSDSSWRILNKRSLNISSAKKFEDMNKELKTPYTFDSIIRQPFHI